MRKRIKDPKRWNPAVEGESNGRLSRTLYLENPAEQPEFDALLNRLTQDLTAKATGKWGGLPIRVNKSLFWEFPKRCEMSTPHFG